MGDNFLRQQIDNFTKKRCRAVAERKRPTLLDRPEVVSTQYPVNPLPGQQLEKGEVLFGVASKSNQHIDVARCHIKVGSSEGDPAKVLRSLLQEQGQPGVVRLEIVEVDTLSGVGQARILPEEGAK